MYPLQETVKKSDYYKLIISKKDGKGRVYSQAPIDNYHPGVFNAYFKPSNPVENRSLNSLLAFTRYPSMLGGKGHFGVRNFVQQIYANELWWDRTRDPVTA